MPRIPKLPKPEEVILLLKDVFKWDYRRQRKWTKNKNSNKFMENFKMIYNGLVAQRRRDTYK